MERPLTVQETALVAPFLREWDAAREAAETAGGHMLHVLQSVGVVGAFDPIRRVIVTDDNDKEAADGGE